MPGTFGFENPWCLRKALRLESRSKIVLDRVVSSLEFASLVASVAPDPPTQIGRASARLEV